MTFILSQQERKEKKKKNLTREDEVIFSVYNYYFLCEDITLPRLWRYLYVHCDAAAVFS